MTFQIIAATLAAVLMTFNFVRCRGSLLYLPMQSLGFVLFITNILCCIGPSEMDYGLIVEWFFWFGLLVSLCILGMNFKSDLKKDPLLLCVMLVVWLLAIVIDHLPLPYSAAMAGLQAVLSIWLIERINNRMPETYRTEISYFLLVLVIYSLLKAVLYGVALSQEQGLVIINPEYRSLMDSVFLVFCNFYVQRYNKTGPLEDLTKAKRHKTNIGIFGVYIWLSTVITIAVPSEFRVASVLLTLFFFYKLAVHRNLFGQLKIYSTKLFSSYKHNYRESWLRFNRSLDEASQEGQFERLSIKALAKIIDSTGGRLWTIVNNRTAYSGHWQSAPDDKKRETLPTTLVNFIDEHNWVVDTREFREDPQVYQGLELDLQYSLFESQQVFIPLRRGEILAGIVSLKAPLNVKLNWEDHDLLKAAGQQMASYLALYEATSRIYEQEQFAAFNRLSAFVVHDLKNVTTQLELISHNAKRFGDNKEFIEDTFDTVASAATRLNKMLDQFKRQEEGGAHRAKAHLVQVYEAFNAIASGATLDGFVPAIEVAIDELQLHNIIKHLHENALEASLNGHSVKHSFELNAGDVLWHITDKGQGMDAEFIRTQLFKPFATTKGNAGMGIGVYQCRYLLRSFGGDLMVSSEVGKGTQVTAVLPIASTSS